MPALVFLTQLASLLATILLPGIALIVVLKRRWLSWLAVPLDGGTPWRDGRPVLGSTKTWLGVVVYVGGATVVCVFLSHADLKQFSAPVLQGPRSAAVGFAIGVAYVLGELANSFVKRRLGIDSSAETTSGFRHLQRFVDLVDGIVAVSLLLLVLGCSPALVAATALAGVAVHAATDVMMHRLRLKSRSASR